jgi:hypothetical protein
MEGKKMGHCVGGYSYNVEKGESRIFHIEVDGISSTLEIGLVDYDDYFLGSQKVRKADRKKKFTIRQHQGRYPEKMGNQVPTNKCRGVGMKLVYYLSKQELSDDEFKEIFKLKDIKNYNSRTFTLDSKTPQRNSWSSLLNDHHRGKNSLNKKRKKKTGDFFNDVLDF